MGTKKGGARKGKPKGSRLAFDDTKRAGIVKMGGKKPKIMDWISGLALTGVAVYLVDKNTDINILKDFRDKDKNLFIALMGLILAVDLIDG